MDIGGWLKSLGLGKYEQVFVANAIDSDVLPELTEGDFEKLDIPLGDRKRLMKAINALGVGSAGAAIGGEIGTDPQETAACRTPSPHGDDLRSGRFDGSFGPA